MADEVDMIFHRKCKKKKGDNRKCKTIYYNLHKEWDYFKNSNFILIPEQYCF